MIRRGCLFFVVDFDFDFDFADLLRFVGWWQGVCMSSVLCEI
jgi:hypothetical protein